MEVKKFKSGKNALSHVNKYPQMMGSTLFGYLYDNVGIKLYL